MRKLLTRLNLSKILAKVIQSGDNLSLKTEMMQFLKAVYIVFKSMFFFEVYRKPFANKGNINQLFQDLRYLTKLGVKLEKEKKIEECELSLTCLINLLCIIRNLILNQQAQMLLLDTKCTDLLIFLLNRFTLTKEIVVNSCRILATLSMSSVFCERLEHEPKHIKSLLNIMKTYKENNYVVMRVSFILANMTTYNEAASSKLYFELEGFKTVFDCFSYYISKTSDEDDFYDSMLKSFSSFDFLKQDDKDVLNKIIRLLANIFTDEKSAVDFIKKNYDEYKFLLRKLRFFMNENEVMDNSELLICVLSCISNILYFDKPGLTQVDFELQTLKQDLTSAIGYIILQPKQEEILIEGLRVISNLSRSKEGVKHIVKIKFHDAVSVLIDHRSREVVYYSIGILINLTQDKKFKTSSACLDIFHSLVELLDECNIDDIDILSCSLKALTNIIYDNLKNNNEKLMRDFSNLDKILQKFGEECDIILTSDEISDDEMKEIKDLKAIINTVVNIIPEQVFECKNSLCNRVFNNYQQLAEHVKRRHPT